MSASRNRDSSPPEATRSIGPVYVSLGYQFQQTPLLTESLVTHGVEGTLRSSELARERIDDARSVLNVGDDVEAKFVNVDKKNRAITLSIRAKESAEEAEMLQDYTRKSSTGTATLGDILKEQMGQQED